MSRAVWFGWNNLDFSPRLSLVVLERFFLEQPLLFLTIHGNQTKRTWFGV